MKFVTVDYYRSVYSTTDFIHQKIHWNRKKKIPKIENTTQKYIENISIQIV